MQIKECLLKCEKVQIVSPFNLPFHLVASTLNSIDYCLRLELHKKPKYFCIKVAATTIIMVEKRKISGKR